MKLNNLTKQQKVFGIIGIVMVTLILLISSVSYYVLKNKSGFIWGNSYLLANEEEQLGNSIETENEDAIQNHNKEIENDEENDSEENMFEVITIKNMSELGQELKIIRQNTLTEDMNVFPIFDDKNQVLWLDKFSGDVKESFDISTICEKSFTGGNLFEISTSLSVPCWGNKSQMIFTKNGGVYELLLTGDHLEPHSPIIDEEGRYLAYNVFADNKERLIISDLINQTNISYALKDLLEPEIEKLAISLSTSVSADCGFRGPKGIQFVNDKLLVGTSCIDGGNSNRFLIDLKSGGIENSELTKGEFFKTESIQNEHVFTYKIGGNPEYGAIEKINISKDSLESIINITDEVTHQSIEGTGTPLIGVTDNFALIKSWKDFLDCNDECLGNNSLVIIDLESETTTIAPYEEGIIQQVFVLGEKNNEVYFLNLKYGKENIIEIMKASSLSGKILIVKDLDF